MDMFDSFVSAAKDACDKAGKKTEEVVAISKLKLKCSQTKGEIEKASTDFIRLNQLMEEKDAAETALEEKMERWMYLEELAKKIEEQK